MKLQYVKTSNHHLFMDALESVETTAPKDARAMLLNSEPGCGKSACVDYVGSERNAILIEGMPGMTVSYLRELLAYELGVQGGTKLAQQKSILEAVMESRKMLILDEAQHGLNNKAECIEYLRRIAEQCGSVLVMVCHTSERHRFGGHKLAHIATRISALVDFKPATKADTALFLQELCEVKIDDGIITQAIEQSRGRYRLLYSVCQNLEVIAKALGKTELVAADVAEAMLCEDAMRSLNKVRR